MSLQSYRTALLKIDIGRKLMIRIDSNILSFFINSFLKTVLTKNSDAKNLYYCFNGETKRS